MYAAEIFLSGGDQGRVGEVRLPDEPAEVNFLVEEAQRSERTKEVDPAAAKAGRPTLNSLAGAMEEMRAGQREITKIPRRLGGEPEFHVISEHADQAKSPGHHGRSKHLLPLAAGSWEDPSGSSCTGCT